MVVVVRYSTLNSIQTTIQRASPEVWSFLWKLCIWLALIIIIIAGCMCDFAGGRSKQSNTVSVVLSSPSPEKKRKRVQRPQESPSTKRKYTPRDRDAITAAKSEKTIADGGAKSTTIQRSIPTSPASDG